MKRVARAICAAMKFFSTLLTALCLVCCATPVPAAFVNGRNYVSIMEWARGNGFSGFTRNRGDEIVLTNRTSRLVFDVNSHDVEINGVNVRLSFPVAGVKGVPLIAQLDLDTTIRPLLFPQKTPARKITTICLDPGHGGRDTGNRVGGTFFGHSEKTYTLALALELRDQLKKAGFNVILTRSRDVYVELPDRPAMANRTGADLFVSLHFNATSSGKAEVRGAETYCITPVGASSSNAQGEGSNYGPTTANRVGQKSLLLAYQVHKSLTQGLLVEDRDVRRARFAVLRDAAMPAILIEGGYMTHPVEGKKIFDTAYRKQMAQQIVKGILAYQKLTAPPVPVPSTVTKTNLPSASVSSTNKVSNMKRAK
jgi:N-acetylmuramoyl-L-alanine amidase